MPSHTTNEKICAIVVTYNRKKFLLECLEAIRKQTRPVDAILIVDNYSTDGTPELLYEARYISELPPINSGGPWVHEHSINNYYNGAPVRIYYIRMNENTGGAGGFHEGLKRAYALGYDWFWLMDDDGYPSEECLEILLSYKEYSDFISPVVLDRENPVKFAFLLDGRYEYYEDVSSIEIIHGAATPFNGILLSKRVVSQIGFPKRELFIYGDEFDYLYRTQKKGYNVITVTRAKFYHPTGKFKKLLDLKLFNIRTSILDFDDMFRFYCFHRNTIYLWKKYNILKLLPRIIKYTLFYSLTGKYKKLLLLMRAIIDGIFENWGNEKKYLNMRF